LGWKLRKPISVTTDPNKLNNPQLNLVHTTEYEPSTGNVIETKMPAAVGKDANITPIGVSAFGSKGSGTGQVNTPTGVAIDAHGDVWVTDYENNRIDEFSASGVFTEAFGFGVSNGEAKLQGCTSSCKAGISGSGNGQLAGPTGIAFYDGDLYVSDLNNDRVDEFNEKGEYVNKFGTKGSGAEEIEGAQAVAVNASGDIWVADLGNHRADEFTSAGKGIESIGWGVSNGEAKFEICTTSCKAGLEGSGSGELSFPAGLAVSGTNLYIIEFSHYHIEEFDEKGEYLGKFGSHGKENGEFEEPRGIAASPVNGNLYITDLLHDNTQIFSSTGTYVEEFGRYGTAIGQVSGPEAVTINSTGDVYVADTGNNRIEEWQPGWKPAITGNEGAHDTKTIYYTTAASTEYKECGEHAEWANLPCIVKPAAQPETAGLPELATTKYEAYNMWDEPETTIETVGSTTRTKTDTYDEAGRLKTSATTSTVGTTLPTVTDTYNKETGVLEKESTTTEGKTKTITSIYNTLGQLTSYTDASEVTSTYEYDVDGRIHKTNDGKGTQTYAYNEAGLPSELVDSSAAGMKFTATYDVEGKMLTEGYPNGMTATYTYNAEGAPTSLVYKKITNCTEEEKEKCVWFKDAIVPSIYGQWLSQTSTLSKQTYTYDEAGRLTQVQNTPTGGDCTTRIYGYDEDTNRTSLTTRNSSSEKCATEGGSTEWHTYDTADRLTGTGFSYNTFGDITALPSQGSEDPELTSAYYVDNQLASQKQKEQTIGYNLDPADRTLETVSTGKPLVADTTFNYDGPSDVPSWTNNATASEWSRNIPGINGSLVAIQNNGASPVLQLTNLHGDVIATASTSETATGLLSKTDTSEFGVPTATSPSPYSWLGADGLRTELPSGAINMGARSYVPQLGRFLQPDPVPGGSANAYSYTFGDPVDTSDPTGMFVEGAYLYAFNSEENQRSVEREAAREAAARAAAEQAAREAQEAAERAAGPQYEEPGPLGGSNNWACEYAAETGQEDPGCGGGGASVGGGIVSDGISFRQGLCAGLAALTIACSPQTRPDDGPPDYSPPPVEHRGEGNESNRPGECACDGDPDPEPVEDPGGDDFPI
jgi:RHS repeat-associated protein